MKKAADLVGDSGSIVDILCDEYVPTEKTITMNFKGDVVLEFRIPVDLDDLKTLQKGARDFAMRFSPDRRKGLPEPFKSLAPSPENIEIAADAWFMAYTSISATVKGKPFPQGKDLKENPAECLRMAKKAGLLFEQIRDRLNEASVTTATIQQTEGIQRSKKNSKQTPST